MPFRLREPGEWWRTSGNVFSNVLPTMAATCLIWFLKPIKKLFLCTFQKYSQFFFLDSFFHFLYLFKMREIFMPHSVCGDMDRYIWCLDVEICTVHVCACWLGIYNICNICCSVLYNLISCWYNVFKLWISCFLELVNYFCSIYKFYRFIKYYSCGLHHVCLSVKRILFVSLSCYQNTLIVFMKAACLWRLTCSGVGSVMFSGNRWQEHFSALLYAWFSKGKIFCAVLCFVDVLIQNICSNIKQLYVVALSLCAFCKL